MPPSGTNLADGRSAGRRAEHRKLCRAGLVAVVHGNDRDPVGARTNRHRSVKWNSRGLAAGRRGPIGRSTVTLMVGPIDVNEGRSGSYATNRNGSGGRGGVRGWLEYAHNRLRGNACRQERHKSDVRNPMHCTSLSWRTPPPCRVHNHGNTSPSPPSERVRLTHPNRIHHQRKRNHAIRPRHNAGQTADSVGLIHHFHAVSRRRIPQPHAQFDPSFGTLK